MVCTIPALPCIVFTVEKSTKNFFSNKQECRDLFGVFSPELKGPGEALPLVDQRNTCRSIPSILIGG